MIDELESMLRALDGVRQDRLYHPEGDALTHTLQVFDRARRDTDDPVMIAAALLHDVGKAIGGRDHDAEGASLLDGLVHERIVYLVEHHLDLLRAPAATRRRLRHTRELSELERLRRYDVAGRVPGASAPSLDEALRFLVEISTRIVPTDAQDDDDECAAPWPLR